MDCDSGFFSWQATLFRDANKIVLVVSSIGSGNRTLRVLLLGSHLNYNLEHYVKMALERMGCEVNFVGYREFLGRLATPLRVIISRSKMARQFIEPLALRKFNGMAKRVGCEFEPELVLAIKGEAVLPKTVEWFSRKLGAITALWYPDDPRYFDSLSKQIAPSYDFVFTSSERSVSAYQEVGVSRAEHLPFACEPSVHRPVALSRRDLELLACDLCFVGTFSRRRARVVHALERAGLKVKVWGPYWKYFKRGRSVQGPVFGPEMTRIFNGAKVVLNVHDKTDLSFKPNMRIFEATGCRSLVLTDAAFGLENLFKPGEEILCYNDEAELLSLAKHYSLLSADGANIAAKAHQRAYREHTYDKRLKTILETVA